MSAGDRMVGRRVDPTPAPGDYGPESGGKGGWWLLPPHSERGGTTTDVPDAEVTEHDDGTISVASRAWPSGWNGRLEQGIWIEE